MGGNSIEVSLIGLSNGLYRCIDSISLTNIGGDQFSDIIIGILCEEFQKYINFKLNLKILCVLTSKIWLKENINQTQGITKEVCLN